MLCRRFAVQIDSSAALKQLNRCIYYNSEQTHLRDAYQQMSNAHQLLSHIPFVLTLSLSKGRSNLDSEQSFDEFSRNSC